MRSELEKIISSSRAAFDTESPAEGHMDRFTAKLAKAEPRKAGKKKILDRRSLMRIAGVAASVVLMLMLINPLTEMTEHDNTQLAEAAEYFAYELRSKAEEVKALAQYIDQADRYEVINDIESLSELSLDHIPPGMKTEEEIIGLLFEHYQAKSSSLEMIENSITNIIGTAD